MTRTIFINLPVADVARATRFYAALGFTRNTAFSNEQASAMEWSDAIKVMLLDHAFYATFTSKPIADAQATSSALYCLSLDSRGAVDAITRSACAAGGRETRAIEDQGFMYGGAFEDPDGHTWETVFMEAGSMETGAEDIVAGQNAAAEPGR